jgi:ectoine hydrolase
MPDDRIHFYLDHFVQNPVEHPMQDLAVLISELGHATARIGLELDNYYFSARAYLELRSALPEATLIDATALVNWQRIVKSEEEIALMRRAARISEAVVDGVIERHEPGMRKNELVAEIYGDLIRGIGDDWGDYPAIVPLLPTGAGRLRRRTSPGTTSRSRRRRHLLRDRRLPPPLPLPAAAPCSSASRRRKCARRGRPRRGLEAGIDAARAGNPPATSPARSARSSRSAGITKDSRCGYPIGLSYPPDWGERTISFREEDPTPFSRPGMTFHFMPGLWFDDWGLEITETILIRENGPAECLADRPRGTRGQVDEPDALAGMPRRSSPISSPSRRSRLSRRQPRLHRSCRRLLEGARRGRDHPRRDRARRPTCRHHRPGRRGGVILSGPCRRGAGRGPGLVLSLRADRGDDRLYGRGSCDMKGFVACASRSPRPSPRRTSRARSTSPSPMTRRSAASAPRRLIAALRRLRPPVPACHRGRADRR